MKSVQISQSFSLKWIQIFSYVRITDIIEFLQEILTSPDLLSLNSQSLYIGPHKSSNAPFHPPRVQLASYV